MLSYLWTSTPWWAKGAALLPLCLIFLLLKNASRENIMIGVVVITMFAGPVLFVFGPPMLDSFHEHVADVQGISATAVIDKVADTGNRYNYNPEVKLTLKIMPQGQRPIEVTVKKIISPVNMAAFQPGSKIDVRYVPTHPDWLEIK